jgi:hypothetical protein
VSSGKNREFSVKKLSSAESWAIPLSRWKAWGCSRIDALTDRLIVVMARLLKAPVVTIDRRIIDYGRQGRLQVLVY